MLVQPARRQCVCRCFDRPLFLALLFSALAGAFAAEPVERGAFVIYAWSNPWGRETYEIRRDGDSVTLEAAHDFGIGGPTGMPVRTVLRLPEDGLRFRGDVPISSQMLVVREWEKAGRPKTLAIEQSGRDTVRVGGRSLTLDRFRIGGVVWGREVAWFDAQRRLIAAVYCRDSYILFQAILAGFESARPFFLRAAAEDGLERIAQEAAAARVTEDETIAITGGLLIDGANRPATPDSAVLIRAGQIVAAGPRRAVEIPAGAAMIDAAGKTVLPGLWDMHAHYRQVEWGPAYLAAGVTTVRDLLNEFEFAVALRDGLDAGRGLGPRMLLAGVIDGVAPAAVGVQAGSPAEAVAAVARYHAAGYRQIKTYNFVEPRVLRAIAAEAHRLGMRVSGHVPHGMNAFEAVEAGLDEINHLYYVAPALRGGDGSLRSLIWDAAAAEPESAAGRKAAGFFRRHGTVIDPTLALAEITFRPAGSPLDFEPGAAALPPLLKPAIERRGAATPREADAARAGFENLVRAVGALHRAGVPIVAGTDRAVPAHSLHRELELYVRAGMTPLEAIQSATSAPARIMGLASEAGAVEAGKRADLVIVDGNPLARIGDIRRTRYVVAKGRVYDCAALWRAAGFRVRNR